MDRIVFFADVLGFSSLARRPGAAGAVDALSDLATVLSSNDEIARLVRSDVWMERYGLSDSIFLVAEDPRAACAAAVELFFNLANPWEEKRMEYVLQQTLPPPVVDFLLASHPKSNTSDKPLQEFFANSSPLLPSPTFFNH